MTHFDPFGDQPFRARVDARSNHRSSSTSATRMRRPRRTMRSSLMTCSSKRRSRKIGLPADVAVATRIRAEDAEGKSLAEMARGLNRDGELR